jgi:F-type H+-transporting ATPase subunit b
MANEHDGHAAGTEVPGGAGHSDVFPPFDTTHFSSQLVWLALTFGALYLLMSKVALPRVAGILENRQNAISGDLDRAALMQKQADDAGKAYEKTLADAKARAQAMGQEAAAKSAAESEAKRKALEAELNGKLAAAETQIAAAKAQAMSNVDGIAREAAAAIVQQLTGKAASPDAIAQAVAAATRS